MTIDQTDYSQSWQSLIVYIVKLL